MSGKHEKLLMKRLHVYVFLGNFASEISAPQCTVHLCQHIHNLPLLCHPQLLHVSFKNKWFPMQYWTSLPRLLLVL